MCNSKVWDANRIILVLLNDINNADGRTFSKCRPTLKYCNKTYDEEIKMFTTYVEKSSLMCYSLFI
jgi:hypothetical protein